MANPDRIYRCRKCGNVMTVPAGYTIPLCCDDKQMESVPIVGETTNEVRVTSETGGQKGMKPQRMSLLPFGALAKIGEVYGFGEKKYAAHNWRKGYNWDLSIDAVYRHLGAFTDGQDDDPESGLSHLAHAGFHILTLLTFVLNPLRYKRFDTRHGTVEETIKPEEVTFDPTPDQIKQPRWTTINRTNESRQ